MVIGNGLIAKKFDTYRNDKDTTIFASGVSNSKNTDPVAYQREINLLQEIMRQYPDTTLVYFSTCSIYDPEQKNSPYVLHKLLIEQLIKQEQKSYYIFRVSNPVGKTDNQNTIINFLVNHINNHIHFDLWNNAERNIIDIDDMYEIIHHILSGRHYPNHTINIANPSNYRVKDIIAIIETLSQTRAIYTPLPKGQPFEIDISLTLPIIDHLGIQFGRDYLFNLLQKYYYR